jgi:hypothetical protein
VRLTDRARVDEPQRHELGLLWLCEHGARAVTQRTDRVVDADGNAAVAFTDEDHLDAETVRALAVEAGATPELVAALLDQLDD